MTHWNSPDGHGMRMVHFMTQLYPTPPQRRLCCRAPFATHGLYQEDGWPDGRAPFLRSHPDAVPLLSCGDTIVTNAARARLLRQLFDRPARHAQPGFPFARRVLGVTAKRLHGVVETYDEKRVVERRASSAGIDARRNAFRTKGLRLQTASRPRRRDRWTEAAARDAAEDYNQPTCSSCHRDDTVMVESLTPLRAQRGRGRARWQERLHRRVSNGEGEVSAPKR